MDTRTALDLAVRWQALTDGKTEHTDEYEILLMQVGRHNRCSVLAEKEIETLLNINAKFAGSLALIVENPH